MMLGGVLGLIMDDEIGGRCLHIIIKSGQMMDAKRYIDPIGMISSSRDPTNVFALIGAYKMIRDTIIFDLLFFWCFCV